MSENCTHDCSTCSSACASRTAPQDLLEKPNDMTHVKKLIGVVSGKGGVGKSLVTSLLAVGMARQGYKTAILDADKLGQGFVVFCSVKLRQMNTVIANDFVEKIQEIPEVTECYNISGEFDYLLKIHAPDMKYYNHFLINVLGQIESLGSIQSSFVMNEIKQNYGLHL